MCVHKCARHALSPSDSADNPMVMVIMMMVMMVMVMLMMMVMVMYC
jgi:uncharacterized protein (DUF983 family)